MVEFTTTILQFAQQGDKTNWTYIIIPQDIADELKPGNRRSFRVKGKLDNFAIKGIAVMPKSGGGFIMAINAAMRKGTGKRKGAMLKVRLALDKEYKVVPPADLMECFADEPVALEFFYTLPKSHRDYFVKWIESAKTEATRTNRIAITVTALSKGKAYGEMLRELKKKRNDMEG